MYKYIHHPFIHAVFCTETTKVVQAATHMRTHTHTHNIHMLKARLTCVSLSLGSSVSSKP